MPEYNDAHLLDFERAGKVTASLVAAIMGVDPYVSRQEAWRRIKGTSKQKPVNRFQSWGIEHEADALAEFEVQSGFLVRPGQFVPHPHIPWLGASPDGFTGAGEPVEVKCPVKLHAEVPEHYKYQVWTQIECCDTDCGYFASWIIGEDEKQYLNWWPVCANKKYWYDVVYKELHTFYFEYLLKDVEPPRRKRGQV